MLVRPSLRQPSYSNPHLYSHQFSRYESIKISSLSLLSVSHSQRDIHSPRNSRQRTNQVPPLHRLDQRKVDERHRWPELRSSKHEGPKLCPCRGPDSSKIDAVKVDGAGAGPVLCGGGQAGDARGVDHGLAQGVGEGAEEEGVEGGADGLVEEEFEDGVCEGEGRRL